jgi:hypothetical protein
MSKPYRHCQSTQIFENGDRNHQWPYACDRSLSCSREGFRVESLGFGPTGPEISTVGANNLGEGMDASGLRGLPDQHPIERVRALIGDP